MKRLLGPGATLLALLLLHVFMTFPMLVTWESFQANVLRGSIDLFLLLAAALFGGALGRPRLAAHLATILALLLTAFRAAVVLMPTIRGCEFEFSHVAEVHGLWHYFMHDRPVGEVVGTVALAVCGLAVPYVLLAWSFARIARVGAAPRRALVFVGAMQACVVATVLHASFSPAAPSRWNPCWFAGLVERASVAIRRAIDPSIVDAPIRARIAAESDAMARAPGNLRGLGGADVHLVLLESYGRVAQRHPEIATRMRVVYDELAAQVKESGFRVVSSVCRPAVRGGGSWIARAQLYSGVRLDSERSLELLLASDAVALPAKFAAAGYRTVEVQSAMDRHCPERAVFFGFRDEITQIELGYTGTTYHWGLMPDQFALHHLLRNVVEPVVEPVFTSFVSATNHAPFTRVPPYVDDWRIDGGTFAGPPRVVHDVPAFGISPTSVTLAAYRDTLEYSLRTIVGFACRLKRPSLVIVIGDHQPAFTSLLVPPDRSFDVPIHLFGNRVDLMAPIMAALPFVEGFEIPADREAFDTRLFAPALLNAYAK